MVSYSVSGCRRLRSPDKVWEKPEKHVSYLSPPAAAKKIHTNLKKEIHESRSH
jgi:hypothetical protein